MTVVFTWTPYKHAIIAYILRAKIFLALRSSKTVSFGGQVLSKDIFLKSNGGYCVYLSYKNFSQHTGCFSDLQIGKYHLGIPQFYLEHIQSRYASRPIVIERKYLKLYKSCNFARLNFILTRFQFSVSCYPW